MRTKTHWLMLALSLGPLGVQGFAQGTACVSLGLAGGTGNGTSLNSSISADGRFVAFESLASDLIPIDVNGVYDIFVRDTLNGTTERVSVDSGGMEANGASRFPSISADGSLVAFQSAATNLVAGGVQGIYLHDRLAGTTECLSVDSSGGQGNGYSLFPSISANGNSVAFWSDSSNLVPNDTNAVADIFVRDRLSATTERVSVGSNGAQANGQSGFGTPDGTPAISADGQFVAFVSDATNLVQNDTNFRQDIFVRDRLGSATERVSLSSSGVQGNDTSEIPSISDDGRFVAFASFSSNLVGSDTNGTEDIFVRDRQGGGTTERVSVTSGGAQSNSVSYHASISVSGRFVAFDSLASNLVTGDSNGFWDVFLRDRQAGTTERISVDSSGAQGNQGSGGGSSLMSSPVVSDNGRYVAFLSSASNLVSGDANGTWDVFLRDRGVSAPVVYCTPGDAGVITCPCSNSPSGGDRGCDNSAATGGATITSTGTPSLAADTIVFTTSAEKPTATSIVLQGTLSSSSGLVFGQGVRCVVGTLKRLYVKTASGGSITAPLGSDPSVSARSAALGNPISAGQHRYYMVYYRDPIVLGGCPATSTFNATDALDLQWMQ